MVGRTDVVHGFSTRADRQGDSLDLRSGARPDVWERLAKEVGMPDAPVAFASQVHGKGLLKATEGGLVGEADALWTDVPGLLLAIRTADCVPIVAVAGDAVGVVHAGWRGLAEGVIAAAVDVLRERGPIHAVVGPAICMDCYEVGEEVVEGLARWVPEQEFVSRSHSKPHVDPSAAAVAQLRDLGVQQVERIAVCSQCDDRLWSYRQSGPNAGRQAGVIGLIC
jgi:hypothetical protein